MMASERRFATSLSNETKDTLSAKQNTSERFSAASTNGLVIQRREGHFSDRLANPAEPLTGIHNGPANSVMNRALRIVVLFPPDA